MNSCDLAIFISTIACSLTKCYSPEELAVIASSLTQLGDTLGTILANEELCKKTTE